MMKVDVLDELERRATKRMARYNRLQQGHQKRCAESKNQAHELIALAKIHQCQGHISAQARIIDDIKQLRRMVNK